MIVLIDNYDSFTYNLVQKLGEVSPGVEMKVIETLTEANGDADIHVLGERQYEEVELNALVRAAAIVVQKSIKEGFGLTVTEALWKRKAVIATPAGGLPTQVLHDRTGVIAWSVEEVAGQICRLLGEPELMRKLGEAGHQRVCREFLITAYLRRWLLAMDHVVRARVPAAVAPKVG